MPQIVRVIDEHGITVWEERRGDSWAIESGTVVVYEGKRPLAAHQLAPYERIDARDVSSKKWLVAVLVLALLIGAGWFLSKQAPATSASRPGTDSSQNRPLAATASLDASAQVQPTAKGISQEEQYVVSLDWNLRGDGIVRTSNLAAVVGLRGVSGNTSWVFFFYNGRYLGTDTFQPSNHMGKVSVSGPEQVSVEYLLYRKGDVLCCPQGGASVVRFKWNGQKLEALDNIPSSRIWVAP